MAVQTIRATQAPLWDKQIARWIPVGLFLAALVIRVIRAGDVLVTGDEVNSLQEARTFANFNGILYFFILKQWQMINTSPLWVRLPSIVFGALSVVVLWAWLRDIRPAFVALLASLLLMFSPLAVEYSQQIRFYALYVFATLVFFWLYWRQITGVAKHPWEKLALIGAAILTLLSHLIGTLAIGFVVLHWIFCQYFMGKRRQWLFLGAGVVLVGVFAAIAAFAPDILERGYQLERMLTNTPVPDSYPGPRGLSYVSAGKLGLLYHYFSVGQFVYPLNLIFTVPALLLIGVTAILGAISLFRLPSKQFFWFAVALGLGPIIAMYIGLDSVWPKDSPDSAAPRYVLFTLPIFLWVLAEGVYALRSNKSLRNIGTAAALGLLATQLVGLWNLYSPDWHNGTSAVNFSGPLDAIRQTTSPLVIVADGRSVATAYYYLTDKYEVRNAWNIAENTQQFPTEGQIAFLASDSRDDFRCKSSVALEKLTPQRETYARVDYPFFAYMYDMGVPAATPDLIPVPRSIYSIKFGDLRLPQQATWSGKNHVVAGMYTLPTCDKTLNLKVDNLKVGGARSLLLLSNLTNAEKVADEQPIATLVITDKTGAQTKFTLRKGYETQSWDGQCVSGCQPVLSWHKRVAMVGASSYAGAYRDFQAKIWGVELPLQGSTDIQSVELTVLETGAELHLWGLHPVS
jgi:hypothetical protein